MRHATALLYHVCAVASRNIRFASCGTSGKLTLWTRTYLGTCDEHCSHVSALAIRREAEFTRCVCHCLAAPNNRCKDNWYRKQDYWGPTSALSTTNPKRDRSRAAAVEVREGNWRHTGLQPAGQRPVSLLRLCQLLERRE
jgi:hypothetical protein